MHVHSTPLIYIWREPFFKKELHNFFSPFPNYFSKKTPSPHFFFYLPQLFFKNCDPPIFFFYPNFCKNHPKSSKISQKMRPTHFFLPKFVLPPLPPTSQFDDTKMRPPLFFFLHYPIIFQKICLQLFLYTLLFFKKRLPTQSVVKKMIHPRKKF